MTTEDRVTLLEQSLATLNRVVAEQQLHGRDIDHNLTILLGIASSQQLDIKEVKNELGTIREHIGHLEIRLDALSQQVDRQFTLVESRLSGIDQHLAALIALVKGEQQP